MLYLCCISSISRFAVCGSTEKKRELRFYVEKCPMNPDLSADTVPDTNVLTSLLKDYLRELPEPVVPNCIYQVRQRRHIRARPLGCPPTISFSTFVG